MKKSVLALLLLAATAASAQEPLNTEGQDSAYVVTITARAQKIIDEIGISDADVALSVRNVVANHYFRINTVEQQYEQTRQFARDSLQGGRRDHVLQGAERRRQAELYQHHYDLESHLAFYVDADAIDRIKDAITLKILPWDYNAFIDMIPSLTDAEKAQILAWLREAREFALDAGSAKAKHAWFGKYKGRINNWLSARGYDLQRERQAWEQRNAARQQQSQ